MYYSVQREHYLTCTQPIFLCVVRYHIYNGICLLDKTKRLKNRVPVLRAIIDGAEIPDCSNHRNQKQGFGENSPS